MKLTIYNSMSNKRIIYPTENGGVAIIIPSLNAKNADESYDEFIERIAKKDVPAGYLQVYHTKLCL